MSVYNTAISSTHVFSKSTLPGILLIEGFGVLNDCHAGPTVQHRSRLHIRPPPANLRQVHLQSIEQLREYDVEPAALGENITTTGIDLAEIGEGWRLHFEDAGPSDAGEREDVDVIDDVGDAVRAQIDADAKKQGAIVRVTGVRNPCHQIDKYRKGLQEKFIVRDENRNIIHRKAGIMTAVERGGWVRVGMKIVIEKVGSQRTVLQPV